MTCRRCGAEYDNPTETMAEHELCILCVMEWHREGSEKTLEEFSEESRKSHFKM